ncbi:DUF4345 domain-containing protein [Pseudodesulfovibrio sp. JC047]|uniref:DUF4345 domain-containing protein n=1 Tax=Pseudodesulfovibrio sp. JC047 TaxID=2683199 RepID=UPI0013D047E1|nr:DUF4345 domain-containing protein [Pseudodesulfovibrio sp. JC047]NDV18653.1 DUF4345 domain-containing protein [Pseudodesulfovibrio sp. JC047]
MPLKKYLLILSCGTISLIAVFYGVSPAWFFASFLSGSMPPSLDQAHILRAVMGLYLALGGFWLFAAFSDRYRDAGVLVLCLFCGGLVSGRILSLIVDGMPSPILMLYVVMECALIPVCLWLLMRKD